MLKPLIDFNVDSIPSQGIEFIQYNSLVNYDTQ